MYTNETEQPLPTPTHMIQYGIYHYVNRGGWLLVERHDSFNGIGNILLLWSNGGLMDVCVLIILHNVYLATSLQRRPFNAPCFLRFMLLCSPLPH
jgi:hypothetical protein